MISSKDNRKVPHYITSATIISEIIDPSHWNVDGNYTGSTTGLLAGDCYIDDTNKIRYEYTGSKLYRNPVNDLR